MNKQNLDAICDELRRRICTGEIPGGSVIHESTLGQEFGISRTPIRQVLHKLAIQHFIETKTGVGSVVVENDRFNLKQDLKVCKGLLSLSLKDSDTTLEVEDQVELAGLKVLQVALQDNPSLLLYWDAVYQLNKLIARNIPHDLVRENFKLITYRIYRLVISRNKSSAEKLVESLNKELDLISVCATSNELLKAKSKSITGLTKL